MIASALGLCQIVQSLVRQIVRSSDGRRGFMDQRIFRLGKAVRLRSAARYQSIASDESESSLGEPSFRSRRNSTFRKSGTCDPRRLMAKNNNRTALQAGVPSQPGCSQPGAASRANAVASWCGFSQSARRFGSRMGSRILRCRCPSRCRADSGRPSGGKGSN